jgi:hypothetical protein
MAAANEDEMFSHIASPGVDEIKLFIALTRKRGRNDRLLKQLSKISGCLRTMNIEQGTSNHEIRNRTRKAGSCTARGSTFFIKSGSALHFEIQHSVFDIQKEYRRISAICIFRAKNHQNGKHFLNHTAMDRGASRHNPER